MSTSFYFNTISVSKEKVSREEVFSTHYTSLLIQMQHQNYLQAEELYSLVNEKGELATTAVVNNKAWPLAISAPINTFFRRGGGPVNTSKGLH
ncbi:hypothetical protein Pmani_018314 [Petrolisthes manimaculis]|uniref:Uncharacterized protein n=1 Tax=Petrolisthes manimaculis TaxID=1843537 RepID=A0AAE1U4M6_9EUCA|nr:hypothetical protein Pmani_018314 [Petrolisthes manimaculis]